MSKNILYRERGNFMLQKQKIITWIITFTILIGLLPMQSIAQSNNANITSDECTFKFKKIADWGSGFSGEITITNTGNKTIEN
jgi:hypothetical protein